LNIYYFRPDSINFLEGFSQIANMPYTVPDQLLHPTLRSHISAASQICHPTTSGRTALLTEFFCLTGFLCGRPIGLELIARVSERPSRRQRQFQPFRKQL